MMSRDKGQTEQQAGAEKGERVRKTIGEMLSSEQRGVEPDQEDAPGALSAREAVPTGTETPAEVAAQKRLAEIERHVGELVKDPELEQDAKVLERKATGG